MMMSPSANVDEIEANKTAKNESKNSRFMPG